MARICPIHNANFSDKNEVEIMQVENIEAKEHRLIQRTSWERATSLPDAGYIFL
jgi:hypothetical protein